jgi:hypothetical protein
VSSNTYVVIVLHSCDLADEAICSQVSGTLEYCPHTYRVDKYTEPTYTSESWRSTLKSNHGFNRLQLQSNVVHPRIDMITTIQYDTVNR